MRFSTLALAFALCALGAPAAAETGDGAMAATPSGNTAAAAETGTGEGAVASEAATDAGAAPEATAAAPSAAAPEATAATAPAKAARHAIELGPVGYDAEGRPGRIHQVTRGDTLWDISDAYLGTPWVWPSVWKDNGDIHNPHLIHPGDRIWISQGEMRRVSEEEAQALLAGEPSELPAMMDGMPGGEPPRPTYSYTEVGTTGFVTADALSGAAAIVDTPVNRSFLGDHDEVVIGLGQGRTDVGDRFEIFRSGERVFDPDDGSLIGYATEELGWLEVSEVHPESATAVIRLSRAPVEIGDHLSRYVPTESEIELRQPPQVEGRVVFTPSSRLEMGSSDVVFLDRGTADGLQVGSPLEVFRPMGRGVDDARNEEVALPDQVVAKLLVVKTHDDTAAAVVTHTVTELQRGDRFRGGDGTLR